MTETTADDVALPWWRSIFSSVRMDFLASLGLLVVVLALWEYLPQIIGVRSFILPTFSETMKEIYFLVANERFLYQCSLTCFNVFVGFVVGSLFGMVVGYLLGLFRPAEVVLAPYLLLLQIAPKVAFAPLFVLWFGYNAFPKILVTILIVFFPVAINVLVAMRGIDRDLLRLARSLDSTKSQVFWKIQFPASMPELLAGLRIAATLAVIGVAVGEMVGGNTGLGYILIYGQGQANTKTVFAAIIALTVIGIVAYFLVVLLEKQLLKWRPAIEP
jgi:NitT/TauT family transport system permease protein